MFFQNRERAIWRGRPLPEGNRLDASRLVRYLRQRWNIIPATMRRYACEKLSPETVESLRRESSQTLTLLSSSLDGMGEWFCNTLIHKGLAFSYGVKLPIRKLLAPDYQLLTISPSSVAVNQFDIFRGWDASDGMLKSRYCHQQSILKGEHIAWNNRGKNW